MFMVGLINSSTMVFWPCLQYQAHVVSFCMGLKSYQKVFSYFSNILATIMTMVLPCHTFLYLVIHSVVHGSQWGKTAEDFFLSVSFTAFPDALKARHQGGTSLACTDLNSACLGPK